MQEDRLKEEAAKNAQELAAELPRIGIKEKRLLEAWESVEYARLRAAKVIEDMGIFEPNTSRGQKMPKESKAVSVLTKCTASSARLLNELFPESKKAKTADNEPDEEDLDDY